MSETTRKPIDNVKNNEGVFFFQDEEQTLLNGALTHEDVTYQCTLTKRDSSGKPSYNLEGQDEIGGVVRGIIYREEPSLSANGKQRPEFTGQIDTGTPESTRRFAGWMRTSNNSGKAFLSVLLSVPQAR